MSLATPLPCDGAAVRAAPLPAGRPAARGGAWVLAAAILGSSMAFIDGTVVNVALPVLQERLGASVADAQWVVEAYTLLLASLLLVGGSLGDRYGRRRVFAAGIGIFAAASAACGAAPDVRWLIAARALQGVGGALLVPGSLALLGAAFDARERGRAIGTWSAFTAVTAGVGPVLGGWLVENLSWRWIFFINLPLAALTLVMLARVPESRDPDAPRRMDLPGAVLATLGLGGLVVGLVEAPRLGWTAPLVVGGLVGGALALAAFVAVEARSRSPMVPLAVFRSRTFSGANLLTLLLYAALGGAMFFLPFNLIGVQGWSATAAGAAFLPFVVLMTLLSRWSGGLVDRYGARLPLVVGPLVAAVGFALLARPGVGAGFWTGFFPSILFQGLGMSIAVAPLTTAVMGAVDARHAGVASGVNNAVSRAAGLLAIAGMGIVAQASFGPALHRRLSDAGVPAGVRAAVDGERGRLAAAEAPRDASPAVRRAVDRAVDEAFVEAFRRVAWIAAALAVLSAACAWLLIEPPRPPAGGGGAVPAG